VHGGKVVVVPKQTMVLIGGAPALRVGDLAGSAIIGCPVVPNPTGTTKPCTTVVADPIAWAKPTALVLGQPLLTQGSMPSGTTDGLPPAPNLGLMCTSPGSPLVA
jgi:uncharacterized Zn-binding protein involved in type VI secretion